MSEYNIQMNKYNALNTEYDQLYPTTKIKNVDGLGTALQSKPNPNLLDNWYFGNPVNQRGVATSVVDQYGIDRWITFGGTHTVSDGYIEISQNGVMSQLLENYSELNGMEMTASVLTVDGTLYAGTAVIDLSSSTIFQSVIGFISYLTKSGIFQFKPTTGSLKLVAAKLELGSQQTLAHQENGKWVLNEIPDYGEQLRRCKRYFYRFPQIGNSYTEFGIGLAQSATKFYSIIKFPVSMRNAPNLVASGSFRLLSVDFGTAIPVTSIDYDTGTKSSTSDSIKIMATVSSGLTAGNPMYLQANNDPSAHIDFTADL